MLQNTFSAFPALASVDLLTKSFSLHLIFLLRPSPIQLFRQVRYSSIQARNYVGKFLLCFHQMLLCWFIVVYILLLPSFRAFEALQIFLPFLLPVYFETQSASKGQSNSQANREVGRSDIFMFLPCSLCTGKLDCVFISLAFHPSFFLPFPYNYLLSQM